MNLLPSVDKKVVAIATTVHIAIICVSGYRPISLSNGTGFWLYSTISQSIAALFGFIFAGYAFFRSETDLDDADDPEADEIQHRLHSKAHSRLINASIPAALSIIGGLYTLLLMKAQNVFITNNVRALKLFLGTVTFYQAIFAVLASIGFVIHLVNPRRTRQIVEDILEEEAMAGEDVVVGEFLENFARLENLLREIYRGYGGEHERPTAGLMVDYLENENVFKDINTEKLQRVIRYRNLAAHGRIESVDRKVIDDLQEIKSEVADIAENV